VYFVQNIFLTTKLINKKQDVKVFILRNHYLSSLPS